MCKENALFTYHVALGLAMVPVLVAIGLEVLGDGALAGHVVARVCDVSLMKGGSVKVRCQEEVQSESVSEVQQGKNKSTHWKVGFVRLPSRRNTCGQRLRLLADSNAGGDGVWMRGA